MNWINVDDRLPEPNMYVLIFVDTPWRSKGCGIGMDYIDNGSDGNIWACTDKNIITHWMSLPKPPVEE